MPQNNKLILALLVALSALLSGYVIYLDRQGLYISDGLSAAWALCFSVLVAMWIMGDIRASRGELSFGMGIFALVLWPFVLLYQLISSRGLEGFMLYLGFLALYAIPLYISLLAYTYLD